MTHHDLARIPAHLETADARCVEWSKWVKVTGNPFGQNPMWRNYRTPRQWDIDPVIPITINTLAAQEIEKIVATMSHPMRTVLRWCYVWPAIHAVYVAKEVGCRKEHLASIRDDALAWIENSLHTEKCL